ncbi:MAG: agmatinase [Actinobacteria bacterium]|nr:MAG: agmatinase [Actinomycetota bacterium]
MTSQPSSTRSAPVSTKRNIVLLGIPLDANSSHMFGCAAGPAAIRAALHSGSGNGATENGLEVVERLDDQDDLPVSNIKGSTGDADQITNAINEYLDAGRRVLSLGGDHSITFPILRAFGAHFTDLTVVHIDAHPDLYDDLDGNPLSHASPFARAMEQGCMARLIQLGVRTANSHQRIQAKRFGVEMYSPRELDQFDSGSIAGPIYVSIDLDGLDPSVAPGVSHHEPGGLTFREVLDIIDALPGPIVGADIVELNPTRDVVDMTSMVGAKLLKELAGAMLQGPGVSTA